eukprot:4081583-Heterocapsa_arctica.AAC.1
MHKVPSHLAQKVDQQDGMVEELLKMMLDVMSHVHDKAPVRKKEEKHAHKEVQRKFQGPKTGKHGEHELIDKEGGGWHCTKCHKFSTTYLGWKRLIRRLCLAKKKTSRVKWKRSYHRRKWMQRAADKITKGDHSANHKPATVEEDGKP